MERRLQVAYELSSWKELYRNFFLPQVKIFHCSFSILFSLNTLINKADFLFRKVS